MIMTHRKMMFNVLLGCMAAAAAGAGGERQPAKSLAELCPVSDNVRGHENIEWSRAYAYGLADSTKNLPRVLLVGDSICNGYQDGVRELLKGKMNVSYWVSSYCVTSAAYLPMLSIYLDALGLSEGWMPIFDDDKSKSWEERLYNRDVEFNGKTIHVVGL